MFSVGFCQPAITSTPALLICSYKFLARLNSCRQYQKLDAKTGIFAYYTCQTFANKKELLTTAYITSKLTIRQIAHHLIGKIPMVLNDPNLEKNLMKVWLNITI